MSVTTDNNIKCDECGKFVRLSDIASGSAQHNCILPSSEYSDEAWESMCAKCSALNKQEKSA
jgi:hypothetical protein